MKLKLIREIQHMIPNRRLAKNNLPKLIQIRKEVIEVYKNRVRGCKTLSDMECIIKLNRNFQCGNTELLTRDTIVRSYGFLWITYNKRIKEIVHIKVHKSGTAPEEFSCRIDLKRKESYNKIFNIK